MYPDVSSGFAKLSNVGTISCMCCIVDIFFASVETCSDLDVLEVVMSCHALS